MTYQHFLEYATGHQYTSLHDLQYCILRLAKLLYMFQTTMLSSVSLLSCQQVYNFIYTCMRTIYLCMRTLFRTQDGVHVFVGRLQKSITLLIHGQFQQYLDTSN